MARAFLAQGTLTEPGGASSLEVVGQDRKLRLPWLVLHGVWGCFQKLVKRVVLNGSISRDGRRSEFC